MDLENQVTITTEEVVSEIKSTPIETIANKDLASILTKIEHMNKESGLNLNLSINRDHIIDELGEKEQCDLHFTGTLTNEQKDTFEKFKEEVNQLMNNGQNSVKFDVNFKKAKKNKTIDLMEEEQANKDLAERHEKSKAKLAGVQKPFVKMSSKRTYDSKEGEKFSGNLFIGGECPEDLKNDFIQYYDEVAKPAPEVYKKKNQVKYTANTPKEQPVVSVPQKNEIKKKEKKQNPQKVAAFEDPFLREFDRGFEFMPNNWNAFDLLDSGMRTQRRRQNDFDRYANRSFNGNFWRPFGGLNFSFLEL